MSSQSQTQKSSQTLPAPLIMEFAGGLGNQLFQLIAGIYLQSKTNRPLLFDTTGVTRDIQRKLLLQYFAVDTYLHSQTMISTRKKLFSILRCRIHLSLSRFERLIHKIVPYTSPELAKTFIYIDDDILLNEWHQKTKIDSPSTTKETLQENPQDPPPKKLVAYLHGIIDRINADLHKPVYIRGYWQYYEIYNYLQENLADFSSILSVKHGEKESKETQKPKTNKQSEYDSRHVSKQYASVVSSQTIEFIKELGEKQDTCSIHIRRSDYLQAEVQKAIPPLSLEYFEQAIKIIMQQHPNCEFFICTDDIQWCTNELTLPASFQVVSGKHSFSEIDDLLIMNSCTHHILSNSSFSWWGASLPHVDLSQSKDSSIESIIIAPKTWFSNNIRNIYVKNPTWIVV